MSRDEAFTKAQGLYGEQASVGVNHQYPDAPMFVGVKARGEFVKFGAGKTWEEAFAAVVPVIDLGHGKFKKRETK
jgi:hypothetical protein